MIRDVDLFGEAGDTDLAEAFQRCRTALAGLDGARILLTGGTGFFGRWLISLLAYAQREFDISLVVLSRDPAAFRRAYPRLADLAFLSLREGDIRVFEYPEGRFTHIIHAATETSAEAGRDAANLISVIVDGTRRVLEFAAAAQVKRLLFISSGAIYGAQPDNLANLAEDDRGACDPLDPRSAYGQAKRLAEQLCACQAADGDLEAVIARAFAFVGPGLPLDGHFAIGNFIADAAAGRDIVLTGDGRPLRGYLYAADLAVWLVTLLVRGEPGVAYNVGSDEAVSIGDVARRVAVLSGNVSQVEIRGRAAPGDPRARYVPSINRARALGLEAWTSLDDAIARTLEWARRKTTSDRSSATLESTAPPSAGRPLTFVVDVDGVVASLTTDNRYEEAEPLLTTIAALNRLFEQGHRIIMFTARGSATGVDWREMTRVQLERWGLRYHELQFGKPAADYYVDDRLLSVPALAAMSRSRR